MNTVAPRPTSYPVRDLLIADRADILLLKDQVEDVQSLFALLSPHHNVHTFMDAHAALHHVAAGHQIDLILLNVEMPSSEARELCRALRKRTELQDIPIISLTERENLHELGFGLPTGADDYIAKPLTSAILLARVANHVSHGRVMRLMANQNDALDHRIAERTAQLAQRNEELQATLRQLAKTQDVTIVAFSSLAETRDNDTGRHLRRTQRYVRELALALRDNPEYAPSLDDEAVELIYKSAPLHDIGKVAIPDHILLKQGPLTPAEFEIMKTHPEHGFRAISAAEASLGESNSFLHVAREIAYGHHEKWNGSGYPNGLSGVAIPLAARLMAIADVYDALTSRRVYKSSMPHERAAGIIAGGRGSHFDPAIVDSFFRIEQKFAEIANDLADSQAG
ncbi:MAG: HD domain-containing protein [Azonexaceae bacterium]|nr:HD domain-containing protein [Azonexaceae bacterium]